MGCSVVPSSADEEAPSARAAFAQALATTQPTGSLLAQREFFTLTTLPTGSVLAVGGYDPNVPGWGSGYLKSAELYNPATGTFSATGSLAKGRAFHTATLLSDGRVLVVGGYAMDPLTSAEIYSPVTGTWSTTGAMADSRTDHTATLLADGTVLVAGGAGPYSYSRASAELYSPATGQWTRVGSLATARAQHAAVRLSDGRVLVTGGYLDGGIRTATVEIYDPAQRTWSAAAPMAVERAGHTATLLPNGDVIVVGDNGGSALVEVFHPATGQWSTLGSLAHPRFAHTTTLVGSRLVVAGGADPSAPDAPYLSSIERIHWQSGLFWDDGTLSTARAAHGAALLPSGKVLLAAGFHDQIGMLSSAELYEDVSTCSPRTCADIPNACGLHPDGCGGTLDCGSCEPPPPPGCPHSESEVGEPLPADCSPCATVVCEYDSYCCTQAWDRICVSEAIDWCAPPSSQDD